MPPITFSVAELTKDNIRELYLQSLTLGPEKRTHVWLNPQKTNPPPTTPSVHEMEQDVTNWYGGLLSAIRLIEPEMNMWSAKEMCAFILANTQPVKDALAIAA